MPNRNRQRSYEQESEIVKLAESVGVKAERAWGSNGKAMGEESDIDVKIEGWLGQCKRRKKIADYIFPEGNADVQIFRRDRDQNYVTMPLWMFLKIAKIIKEPPK